MAISVARSLALDHSLPTIRSKSFLQELCKGGVAGTSQDYNDQFLLLFRCTACHDDLDGPLKSNQWNYGHTELLHQTFDPSILWDEYGVDEGVMVSFSSTTVEYLLLTILSQPFTNDFPRADIHELLSGDLLHQIIKETFKDYLVPWVEE